MKIGIDCHNLEGQRTGVGRYLINLLREWASEERVEFFLYFKNDIPEDVRSWTSYIRNLHGRSNAIFKHWSLPRAARRDKVDILFCPDYVLPLYLGGRIKTAVAIHDIIYEARSNEYSWPSWKDKILLKWASKQSAKGADIIFSPSEFTKSEIIKYYKINSEKIIVTPLAPDPIFKNFNSSGSSRSRGGSSGSDPDELMEIKKKYGIQDKYVFFVGSIFNRRFLPQKIGAFVEFGKDYPNFQFLIIGKNHTNPFQDIDTLISRVNKELGREAIVCKERASDKDLVWLYNGAFATLWCSSYEGFGLPLLESMACGTPVITSGQGSLPEVAGNAAMYIAYPENPQEITDALVHLVRYYAYYKELVAKGLMNSQNFAWQKTAKQTIEKLVDIQTR